MGTSLIGRGWVVAGALAGWILAGASLAGCVHSAGTEWAPASTPAQHDLDRPPPCPIDAILIRLSPDGDFYGATEIGQTTLLVLVNGHAEIGDTKLAPGDVLQRLGGGDLWIRGEGLAVLATAGGLRYRWGDSIAPDRVLNASMATHARWAEGKMEADLHVEPDSPKDVYVGWLSGTAAVPEHVHADACEVLALIEGAGTLTRDGVALPVKAGQVLSIPAGTKHSYQPDTGTSLRAVQLYSPRGPEQRFLQWSAADSKGDPPVRSP